MNFPRLIALAVAVLCGYLLFSEGPRVASYASEEAKGYAAGCVATHYARYLVDLSDEHPGVDPDDVRPDVEPSPDNKPTKCRSCGGTGRVGDGRTFVTCQACGGDGVAANKVSTQAACQCVDCDCNPCQCGADAKSVSYDTKTTPHKVVVLTSDNCVYCPQMTALAGRLFGEGHEAFKVNVDREPSVAASYGYASADDPEMMEKAMRFGYAPGATPGLPQTLIVNDDFRVMQRFIGVTDEAVIRQAAGLPPAARTEIMTDPSAFPSMSCSGGVCVKQYRPATTVKPKQRWIIQKPAKACVGCQ